jgi:hypothetical protein
MDLSVGDAASNLLELEFGPNLFWQGPLLLLLVFIASGAGHALAERILPSRDDRVRASREAGSETLDAILAFQNALDARIAINGDDPVGEAAILRLRAALFVAAAKTGTETIRDQVRTYATTGARWAVGRPTVLEVQVTKAFEDALSEVAKFMKKNR